MKKGFTLIELLAAVVIIAVILVIAVTKVTDIIANSRINAYIENEQSVKKIAEYYAMENLSVLPADIGDTVEIGIEDLVDNGYMKDIINPADKSDTCSGYELKTKIEENENDYSPMINCISDIGDSTTDGLVAYYKFDDFQEPTINIVTNTNLDTGWSKGYQSNIIFDEISSPMKIDSPNVGFERGNTSGYWYSYGDYSPQVPGQIYTVSVYAKTIDPNFSIRFYTADNSEVGRFWSSSIPVSNNEMWNRIVWNSFVDSQSDSLSFNFSFASSIGDPNSRTWLSSPQMEPKAYATPFVIGTRTGTVKDYSMNINDAILSLSTTPRWVYDEDRKSGAYSFNGNDNVITSNNTFALGNNLSICFWTKPSMSSVKEMVIHGDPGNGAFELYQSGTSIVLRGGATSPSVTGSNALTISNWSHVCGTISNTVGKVYSNGVLLNTGTVIVSNSSARAVNIGAYQNLNYSFNGIIDDVKIYNRVLADSEIEKMYEIGEKLLD